MNKSIFFVFASMLLIASCSKKTVTELPAQNLQGYWVGFYGNVGSWPTATYNFLFRSDGTVRVYESQDTANSNASEGTYQLQGTNLTATYNYQNSGIYYYSVAAAVGTQYTFLEGTWGPRGDATSGGTFYLVRQLP